MAITTSNTLCKVVLLEPLIPENTGNIARTCVGTNSELHIVEPIGFEITESRVKRAGLDYWQHLNWQRHQDFSQWLQNVNDKSRMIFIETHGEKSLFDCQLNPGDWLIFGKETTGIDKTILNEYSEQVYHLPMQGPTRSLNLANTVAVAVFELLRQSLKNRGA